MTFTWQQIVIAVASLVGTTAITFFLKDMLQQYIEYRKLKAKLDSVAGRRAVVIYQGEKYRIESTDRQGLILRNELQTVFIPIKRALDNILTLPSTEYDQVLLRNELRQHEKMKAHMLDSADAMIDQMAPKMIDIMKREMLDALMEDKTELSMAIGFKITKFFEQEGIELKQLEGKQPKKSTEETEEHPTKPF